MLLEVLLVGEARFLVKVLRSGGCVTAVGRVMLMIVLIDTVNFHLFFP